MEVREALVYLMPERREMAGGWKLENVSREDVCSLKRVIFRVLRV